MKVFFNLDAPPRDEIKWDGSRIEMFFTRDVLTGADDVAIATPNGVLYANLETGHVSHSTADFFLDSSKIQIIRRATSLDEITFTGD